MSEIAFQCATPVLRSEDYPRSRAFSMDVPGYAVAEVGGDPPRFGISGRGGGGLFVDAWLGPAQPVAGAWNAYIHVSALEALPSVFEARGAPITRSIEDTIYGMREFEVTDPDGNVPCIGEDEDPTEG